MLYEKYSTVFAFDPPMQNSLYIYIYILTFEWKNVDLLLNNYISISYPSNCFHSGIYMFNHIGHETHDKTTTFTMTTLGLESNQVVEQQDHYNFF